MKIQFKLIFNKNKKEFKEENSFFNYLFSTKTEHFSSDIKE